jgi:carbon-monoxide dehydrogenase large subunit
VAVHRALGGAVKRREDVRLITGAGQYTDDVRSDGALHAVFVRSTFAHARITKVDVSAAAAMPGVV